MMNWIMNGPIDEVVPAIFGVGLLATSIIFGLTFRAFWNVSEGRKWYDLSYR